MSWADEHQQKPMGSMNHGTRPKQRPDGDRQGHNFRLDRGRLAEDGDGSTALLVADSNNGVIRTMERKLDLAFFSQLSFGGCVVDWVNWPTCTALCMEGWS